MPADAHLTRSPWGPTDSRLQRCRGDDAKAVLLSAVGHMRLIDQADLAFPIILASNGAVMDGMHRVAKALLRGVFDGDSLVNRAMAP